MYSEQVTFNVTSGYTTFMPYMSTGVLIANTSPNLLLVQLSTLGNSVILDPFTTDFFETDPTMTSDSYLAISFFASMTQTNPGTIYWNSSTGAAIQTTVLLEVYSNYTKPYGRYPA